MSKPIVITQLSASEAYNFFLKGSSYITTNLPDYFDFEHLLKKVDKNFEKNDIFNYVGFFKNKQPEDCEYVNYDIFHNKNGLYAWRKLEIINPFLYIALARIITEKTNWDKINNNFRDFADLDSKIICSSIPMVSTDKRSDTNVQIQHWWENNEKESIKLSLSFQYLVNTDIADCYQSIYTHSIAWALHDKKNCKENLTGIKLKNDTRLGDSIDKIIRQMHFGQTNGVPQGSVIMDYIAEIVLGYIDTLIYEKIEKCKIIQSEYKILRYRDDYKIFVNYLEDGKNILKIITEVLLEFGLKLSKEKTNITSEIITGAIKEEKTYWLTQHNNIWADIYSNGKNIIISNQPVEERLQSIREYGLIFPNTRHLNKQLHLIDSFLDIETMDCDNELCVAILSDIAFNNPCTYDVIASLISKFLHKLQRDEQKKIIRKIIAKFNSVPNTEMLDIWLQRISLKIDKKIGYKAKICKLVSKKKVKLWNNEWLNSVTLTNIMGSRKNIVNDRVIEQMSAVVDPEEIDFFAYP